MVQNEREPGGLARFSLLGVLLVVVLFWASTLWGSFLSGFSVVILKFISLGVSALWIIPQWLGLPFGRVSYSRYLAGIYLKLTPNPGRQAALGLLTGILLALSLLAANALVGEAVLDWGQIDAVRVAGAVVHGGWEEVFFHGVVLGLCLRKTRSPLAGMALTAGVFAAVHLNLYHFLRLFCMSMLWLVMIRQAGSLLPAVISHVVYDVLFAAFTPAVPEGRVFVWLVVWHVLVVVVCGLGVWLARLVLGGENDGRVKKLRFF